MTGPHERDGRFYGNNQDPYTRDPYRDPYTGDPYTGDSRRDREEYAGTRPGEVTPISRAEPFLNESRSLRENGRRWAGSAAVPPGRYLGGIVAVAVTVGLLAWLLFGLIIPAVYGRVSASTWTAHGVSPAPVAPDAAAAIGLAVCASLLAGALMWVMAKTLPQPVMFFRVLGSLVAMAIAVSALLGGTAIVALMPHLAAVLVAAAITFGVGVCGDAVRWLT